MDMVYRDYLWKWLVIVLLTMSVLTNVSGQNRWDTVYFGIPLRVISPTVVDKFSLPVGLCEGDVLELPTPGVNGVGITGQGWGLDERTIAMPYTLKAADLGAYLYYWAVNTCNRASSTDPSVRIVAAPPVANAGERLSLPDVEIDSAGWTIVAEKWALGPDTDGSRNAAYIPGTPIRLANNGWYLSCGVTAMYAPGVSMSRSSSSGVMRKVIWSQGVKVQVVAADGLGGGCTDSEGNKYKTVIIGDQEWMAENLKRAHRPGYGLSWYNKPYGMLYDWVAAMNGATSSSANPSGVQGICPSGWHLPSDAEWTQLNNYLEPKFPGKVGTALKSISGWNNKADGSSGNGTDTVDFCGIPGGYCNLNGSKNDQGGVGVWWSSTESGSSLAMDRNLFSHNTILYRYPNSKTRGESVRCLKN